ncbi:hypothetical protein D5086_030813 [Populus alba]|uniref:Uncharacterized protein n=1 Tax=Populus alba TaxID=43335 RepID=A0ACC4AQI8_POPAL
MHHVGSILGLEFILMSGEHSFGVADKRKICENSFKFDTIPDVDVYKWDPEELPELSALESRRCKVLRSPKGPLEALRPKLQVATTVSALLQHVGAKETQPSLSSYADGGSAPSEDATANE